MKNTHVTESRIIQWLADHYQVKGQLTPLVGDVDLNYRCVTEDNSYTVKISQVNNLEQFDFEAKLLVHLSGSADTRLRLPKPVLNQQQKWLTVCDEISDGIIVMRLVSWVDGQLWSSYSPRRANLLTHLGTQAARLDLGMQGFDHPLAQYEFTWDLAQSMWIKKHLSLHDAKQQAALNHFIALFEQQQANHQSLRQQVIHNDLNDNNILVDQGQVSGFIDFGDAIKTQLINEVAICCAYAIMHQPDPLLAASQVVSGYHQINLLFDEELKHLYQLIGMRLAVSVTQAALSRAADPDNVYKSISEQPAWDVIEKWQSITPSLAYYQFRSACGMTPHPKAQLLNKHLESCASSLQAMFPDHREKTEVYAIDLSVGSTLLGGAADYEDHDTQGLKIHLKQQQHPQSFLAGGYCEARSFYASDAFSIEGNSGKEYRTMHLGLDVWLPAQTAIHAPLNGRIIALHNNDFKRDYGPTIIMAHNFDGGTFYTLYGHLATPTLALHHVGDEIESGQLLAWVGEPHENGGWSPHLHFQIIHDLLGNEHDFPGASTPNLLPVMRSICPDPWLLFKHDLKQHTTPQRNQDIIDFRHQHLGKSLSLAYSDPIQMLRGDDVYLIDQYGQKYLDTCNNVAHVGHENPAVVKAGQEQMAVLNTNSRYLHPALIDFTEALLATLPPELSVVHMVNSGSEANELALRMAKAYSGGEDIIALESGYHGNSNATINISSYKFDGRGGQGAPDNTHIIPLPDSFRGRHRGTDTGAAYAAYVDQHLDALDAQNKKVAAFIAESIVSCGGQIELPTGYLSRVYQKVRAAGGVCIADEVQVGCGRIGSHFWAFEPHGVVPDILTIGKPIGNGHPLAVVVCTREVADRFANGMEYFNTFGGNPVSATVGHAVLQIIKQHHLQHNALTTGNHLKAQLAQLQQQHAIIKDVRGQGLFLGFELCDDDLNPLPQQAAYLANRMRELGILISTDGPDHNVIKIKPPITFKPAHADELMSRLATVFQENFMQPV